MAGDLARKPEHDQHRIRRKRAFVNYSIVLAPVILAIVLFVWFAVPWLWNEYQTLGDNEEVTATAALAISGSADSSETGDTSAATESSIVRCETPDLLYSPSDLRTLRPRRDTVQLLVGPGNGCDPLGTITRDDRLIPLSAPVAMDGHQWIYVQVENRDGSRLSSSKGWVLEEDVFAIG